MTFNSITCEFECVPQTCVSDSYYWDAENCICACYVQECEGNYIWDASNCCCVCDGPPLIEKIILGITELVAECPCATQWDPSCCEC